MADGEKKREPVRVIECDYGVKKVRLHIRGRDRIVWVEVISPNGDIVELDPNYFDVSPFRALLQRWEEIECSNIRRSNERRSFLLTDNSTRENVDYCVDIRIQRYGCGARA